MNETQKKPSKLRQSGYLAVVTAVVLAIVVVLNLVVGQLPAGLKQFDLSDQKIYTVSDTSKTFLSGLGKDVELIVIAEDSSVDERLSRFFDSYAALSPRVTLTRIDPVAHPSAAEEYGAAAGSVVVRCVDTGKSRTVSFDDMLVYDAMSYYMYGQIQYTSFDAEGRLTSAVDYVTGDVDKVVYTLENHGEAALSTQVTTAIEKANLTLGSASLLLNGAGVPEDCALLISNGASKDLTDDELTMVRAYLDGGGQVMFLLAQTEEALPNWETLMGEYGLQLADGYIADTQRYFPQLGSAFFIAPQLSATSAITGELDSDALSLLVNSRGMTQLDTLPDGVTVDAFLTTSSGGVAVTADNAQTEGAYLLAAASAKTGEDGAAAGRLTVFASASVIDDSVLNTIPTGVNLDIFMNALTAGFTDMSSLTIPAKSLEVAYNTIVNPGMWSLVFVAVIPILTLVLGLLYWARRRKL